MAAVQDITSNIVPKINFGNIPWQMILVIGGIFVFLILVVVLILWILNKKKYNILVEITPFWSVKEAVKEKLVIKEPSKLEKAFGINKPKRLIYQDVDQSSQSYFAKGAYLFNKKTGTYYLQLAGGDKAKVQGLDYKYFKPVKAGSFFFPMIRYIHLLRYGPADYKPIETKFSKDGLFETMKAYDSEATYVSIATQQEVINRFRKGNLFLQLLPWIVAVIVIIAFIIATYMISKQLGDVSKSLSGIAGQLGEVAKSLLAAQR